MMNKQRAFYDPDLISQKMPPPDHKAWKDLEALFKELDESDEEITTLTYESLREQRRSSTRRIDRLYGTEDWD